MRFSSSSISHYWLLNLSKAKKKLTLLATKLKNHFHYKFIHMLSLLPISTFFKGKSPQENNDFFLTRTIYLLFLLLALPCSASDNEPAYEAKAVAEKAFTIWEENSPEKIKEIIKEKEAKIFVTLSNGAEDIDLTKDHLLLAILASMTKNYDQALCFIDNGLEEGSNKTFVKAMKELYELKGLIYYYQEKYEEAQEYFKKAFKRTNSQGNLQEPKAIISVLCYIMRCAYELKRFEEVIFYGKILHSQAGTSYQTNNPEVAEAYEILARAYYRQQSYVDKKQRNYADALRYIEASITIQKNLKLANPLQLLRSHELVWQIHQTTHNFPEALRALTRMRKIVVSNTTTTPIDQKSYLEEKYYFPANSKPLDKIATTINTQNIQDEIKALQEKANTPRKDLKLPPNTIPPITLTYPEKSLLWVTLLAVLGYTIWGVGIYGWIKYLLKATDAIGVFKVIFVGSLLTLIILPITLYFFYLAHYDIALSNAKVGFTKDLLILDETIKTKPREPISSLLMKSLLWFINLRAGVVIPFDHIQKIVWHIGGTMYTQTNFKTNSIRKGKKSDLGVEYFRTMTRKAIDRNAEKYMIIKKAKTISKVENTANDYENNPETYKAVETTKTTTTTFAGTNALAIHTIRRGQRKTYIIDENAALYAKHLLAFLKMLVSKGIPLEVVIDDNSDLLKRKKEYLEKRFYGKKDS